ncbi:MAG TPA: type II toxin-antitoxin system VapC family toxin [Gracilimonas sp.]|uniref:type II toxin-antitoxin system VapC family toxin n=1 Tax=Gracilimonas sp. TaxID=1974203 RepID=UPI002D91FA00|nr:type II toxin-antitoxin system VapC family toxin [Gracilimonas sp.]
MYVDTSSLVAFYVPEEKTETVSLLFQEADEIVVSSLTEVEFISAVNKKLRMNTMTQAESEAAINEFEDQMRKQLISVYTLHQKNYDIAASILKETELPLRALDVLHLSVCYEGKLPILSFDKILLKAAEELEIGIVH